MKISEVAELLAKIQEVDGRTLREGSAASWHSVLESALGQRATHEECSIAIEDHYATTNEWLMPVHVIDLVRDRRRRIAQRHGSPENCPCCQKRSEGSLMDLCGLCYVSWEDRRPHVCPIDDQDPS